MSLDIELHGLPRAIRDVDIAASLVLWCGAEIAELCTEPTIHVRLRGQTSAQLEDPLRVGPRCVEVFRPQRGPARLTMRMGDAFTWSVARGFAVRYVDRFARDGRAVCSETGEVLRG